MAGTSSLEHASLLPDVCSDVLHAYCIDSIILVRVRNLHSFPMLSVQPKTFSVFFVFRLSFEVCSACGGCSCSHEALNGIFGTIICEVKISVTNSCFHIC